MNVPRYCPCQSGSEFTVCCGPYLAGAHAPTAEALMRSRYTAFALGDAAYLEQTWHPDYREAIELDDVSWRRLEVLHVEAGGEDDARGIVEFRAVWRRGSERGEVHERSSFVRLDGRWVYTIGTHATTAWH